MIGVDVLPAQPPRGVSTIQGDFLSPAIQAEVRSFVLDPQRGRPQRRTFFISAEESKAAQDEDNESGIIEAEILEAPSYIDMERRTELNDEDQTQLKMIKECEKDNVSGQQVETRKEREHMSIKEQDDADGRVVDTVLSDMSAPWEQTSGFWKRTVSDPYRRMMNTSGIPFRDHAGSMVCACFLLLPC